LFGHKDEQNYMVCRKMDGIGDHNVEQGKLSSKDKYHVFTHRPEVIMVMMVVTTTMMMI
jgi:hypothetical protein